jgi:hypothetical protein
MPSVHVGWALLAALVVVEVSRSRWRWLALGYPVLTLLAVVVTANHYWMDGIAAALLLALALVLQRAGRTVTRAWRARADARRARRSRPAPEPLPDAPVLVGDRRWQDPDHALCAPVAASAPVQPVRSGCPSQPGSRVPRAEDASTSLARWQARRRPALRPAAAAPRPGTGPPRAGSADTCGRGPGGKHRDTSTLPAPGTLCGGKVTEK